MARPASNTASPKPLKPAEMARAAIELLTEVMNAGGAPAIRKYGPRVVELRTAAAELLGEDTPADSGK